jgi:hypothetical protein
MKNSELSTLDKIALKKAIKETPGLRVGSSVPKSMNKGFSDTPLFSNENNQTNLW